MDTHASAIIPIPLANLRASPLNARTIDGKPVDELAASILSEGLLQNLTVTESGDGTYEVVAGGRRHRALLALRDNDQLPEELQNVPCLIVRNGRAMGASLAENSVREKMHPADEFVAFRKLVDDGQSIEDIAHAFGIQPLQVQRHLRLARVAPSLFELFRKDQIKLDQMHALAVTDDHQAQESAWNVPNDWMRNASEIRSRLTKSEIDIGRDRAAQFVGVDAIVTAGGIVRPDLFGAANSGFTTDRQLIDGLAYDKLDAKAEAVRAEGWAWVTPCVEMPDDLHTQYTRIYPVPNTGKLNAKEAKRLEALKAELAALEDFPRPDDATDFSDEELARYSQLETEIGELEDRCDEFTVEQRSVAGVFVTIGAGGALLIDRGLVRKGTKVPGSSPAKGAGDAKAKKPDLSESLTRRLTAHRTAILQGAVITQPRLALTLLAHSLLLGAFYRDRFETTLCKIRQPDLFVLEKTATELPLMRHWNAMHERIATIRKELPSAPDLFAWLRKQTPEKVDQLLAVCIGLSIDTTVGNDLNRGTRDATNELIAAAGVTLTDHWEATRDTFFDHVPRAVIETAVLEALDQHAVDSLANFKKEKLVAGAEELLAGKQWLPKILRAPKPKNAPADGPTDKAKPKLKPSAKKPAAKPTPKPAVKAKAPAKKVAAKPVKKAASKTATKKAAKGAKS
jgi:ParB family transcriptional regulator, chromosome partitioning protein